MIYITYSDKKQIEKVRENNSLTFHFIDSMTLKGKKEAWKLKSHWAAKLDPFVLITDLEDKPIKVFYSESGDAIEELNKYLENE